VTAGLTWAPEMCPSEATMTAKARPPAAGTASEPYGEPATDLAKLAATTVLTIVSTSTKLPIDSATEALAMLASSG